ncbi:transcriptional regulator protein [Bacillus velezensis]|nr:transcriptional regulator protein [Bacillus velezensis]
MESFGKQLRTLREKRHLTVNQLATYSGVSAAGISRIENGKRGVPKPATIKKLADALKIPYEELMQTAGYIETVQETRAPYDTGCTLLEKAETMETEKTSPHTCRACFCLTPSSGIRISARAPPDS